MFLHSGFFFKFGGMETCDVTYYAPCSKYDLPALLDYIARMLNSLNKTCVYNRFSNEVIGRLLESAIEKEDYKFCKRIREYMKDRHPATGEILDYE